MRLIKFRGKRLSDGGNVIIVGDLAYDAKGNAIIRDGGWGTAALWSKVEPETVGQFIGDTDDNGIEIFETDTIKETGGLEGKEYIGTVVYNSKTASFMRLSKSEDGKGFEMFAIRRSHLTQIEIIK